MPSGRDAEWNLNAKDNTSGATRSAADGFDKLGDKADKATRKLDDLGDEAGQLSRKMLEAQLAARALARQFDKTGDSKLLKDFSKINNEAAKLGRLMKAIQFEPDKSGDSKSKGFFGKFLKAAADAGEQGGLLTVKGFTAAFEALPGPVKTALVAAVVGGGMAVAPLLAAALSGAVLSGIAGGGIAGGLILAAKDPRVAEAYGNMGSRILQQLRENVGKPFAQVLLDEAPEIENAFNRQLPRLSKISAQLARDTKPIITNVLGAFEKIMPSVERASAAGGAILRQLSGQLPGLAAAVGRLFDAFAQGGRGAGDALAFLIGSFRALIEVMALGYRVSAPMLNILGMIAEFTNLVPKASDGTAHWRDNLASSGTTAMSTAMAYEDLAQSLGNTANQANAANDAFNRLFGEQMSVQQANLAVNVGLSQLTETIKGNKKTLDQHTESGQKNAEVILRQVGNYEQQRQAAIAAGNGTASATAQANAAYNSQVSALRNLLLSLGLAAGAVDALIGKLYNIPQGRTVTITTVYRTVGNASGISDQATGHSRTGSTDYGGRAAGWAPAAFAGLSRGFAAAGTMPGGTGYQKPVEVTSELALTVELDGAPFRSTAARVTRASEKRQAWRARVGTRDS